MRVYVCVHWCMCVCVCVCVCMCPCVYVFAHDYIQYSHDGKLCELLLSCDADAVVILFAFVGVGGGVISEEHLVMVADGCVFLRCTVMLQHMQIRHSYDTICFI